MDLLMEKIISSVKHGIEKLKEEFCNEPSLFFTENDIVCRAYYHIQATLNHLKVTHNDDVYYLLHSEFPTPFKCDMRGDSFELKDDDSRFKRAHYDLVVFHPTFLKAVNYDIAKAQRFDLVITQWPGILEEIKVPPILVGMEFMFKRDRLSKAGRDNKTTINWCQEIHQDYLKLKNSQYWKGYQFIKETIFLVFNRYPNNHVGALLADQRFNNEIQYVEPFPSQSTDAFKFLEQHQYYQHKIQNTYGTEYRYKDGYIHILNKEYGSRTREGVHSCFIGPYYESRGYRDLYEKAKEMFNKVYGNT